MWGFESLFVERLLAFLVLHVPAFFSCSLIVATTAYLIKRLTFRCYDRSKSQSTF